VADAVKTAVEAQQAGAPEMLLVLHSDAKMFDGRHAENGWLQELPEPVNKSVWGNALALSAADADALGVRDGDLVEVSAGQTAVQVAALVQPGQTKGVTSAALGYGRTVGAVGSNVGANLFPLIDPSSTGPCMRRGVRVQRVSNQGGLVRTQIYDSMKGRHLARHVSLDEYAHHGLGHGVHHPEADLYPPQEFPSHKWSMVIDLNACVGCGACIVACQSENNIPVVGPEQVEKGREMHWIRVDRYYEGSSENPLTVFQPMLCQHCDKAPCENVCPVNATTHSDEGLNQMAYNRCVGTRYCANNCPYKVRRFNFLDFHAALREPADLAFNPEVSVRPRGVMEKCTFCVQRIEEQRQRAKADGRSIRDGEIKPACAAACPGGAIVFGDLNDPESRVAKLWGSDRGYRVLHAELGVSPAITYLAKLENLPGGGKSG
jgi:molybdopterin-containing oxidoreductase family iron-sulfur binding subunit